MRKLLSLILAASITTLMACNTSEYVIKSEEKEAPIIQERGIIDELADIYNNSSVFEKTITGFALYDPETDKMLFESNADKYLVPASNTKLFTYYAGLNLLGEYIPALYYTERGDSLIFWGSGDPSFLHPDFGTDHVYNFLKNYEGNIYFSDSNFDDEHLGPGWAWGDYDAYYSAERSPLPIYGNFARFTLERVEQNHIAKENGEYIVSPQIISNYVTEEGVNSNGYLKLKRDVSANNYNYAQKSDTVRYQVDKPFHYTPDFVVELLSDTLHKSVGYLPEFEMPEDHETIYGMPADSLYEQMLLPSDNNVAEQIMMMISGELGFNLNVNRAIRYTIENHMDDLTDKPNWRDGSGLSRYNLFTPRSIIDLLKKIDAKVDNQELLFSSLPQGGKQGTIRNLYNPRDGDYAYVFAKTGTLNNSHSLSGYLMTKSGKKLLFSFIHNNFVIPTKQVQDQMEEILWYIHTHF